MPEKLCIWLILEIELGPLFPALNPILTPISNHT